MTPRPLSDPATIFAWSARAFVPAAAALFALDAALGEVVRTTRTPVVGQMRLTWWHDALLALDAKPAPAQPVLRALAEDVVPRVTGAALAGMIDGWDVLIEEEAPDDAALSRHAEARGAGLFAALAAVLDLRGQGVVGAGRAWALADLAGHVGDPALAGRAAALALAEDTAGAPRPLSALARDAALAATGRGAPGGPRRAAGVLRLLLTGR